MNIKISKTCEVMYEDIKIHLLEKGYTIEEIQSWVTWATCDHMDYKNDWSFEGHFDYICSVGDYKSTSIKTVEIHDLLAKYFDDEDILIIQ